MEVIPIGCDEAVFSTDRAFWIPAFAGMTGYLLIHGVVKVNWMAKTPSLCLSPGEGEIGDSSSLRPSG